MEHIAVAIDGPCGAGKSTIAREAAARLKFTYVDTGAMFRAIGLAASRRGVSGKDADGIIKILPEIKLELTYMDGAQHILLCGEDVTEAVRAPEISQYASEVSQVPEVRAFLLNFQRDLAKEHNVIMDGRDIGTVVLPEAQVKLFLTASDRVRAERRYKELIAKGGDSSLEKVLRDIRERDKRDMTRKAAPLRQAEDAILLDTTNLDLGQSIEAVIRIIAKKCS